MDTATRVQILDETDCISHSTNTLGKGMNSIILPPARRRKTLNSNLLNFALKLTLSYPARAEGLVNIYKSIQAHDYKIGMVVWDHNCIQIISFRKEWLKTYCSGGNLSQQVS